MDDVSDRVILELIFVHLLFTELACDRVRVPHGHLAAIHVVGEYAAGELFETQWALCLLLLAEVGHMFLILGQWKNLITCVTYGHIAVCIALSPILILILFFRTIGLRSLDILLLALLLDTWLLDIVSIVKG